MLKVFLLFFILFNFSVFSDESSSTVDNVQVTNVEKKDNPGESSEDTKTKMKDTEAKKVDARNDISTANPSAEIAIEKNDFKDNLSEIEKISEKESPKNVKKDTEVEVKEKEDKKEERDQIIGVVLDKNNPDKIDSVNQVEQKKIVNNNSAHNPREKIKKSEGVKDRSKENINSTSKIGAEEAISNELKIAENLDSQNQKNQKEKINMDENKTRDESKKVIVDEKSKIQEQVNQENFNHDEVYFGAGVVGYTERGILKDNDGSQYFSTSRHFAPSIFTGARHNFRNNFMLGVEYDVNFLNLRQNDQRISTKFSYLMNLSIVFGYNLFNNRFTPFISFGPSLAFYEATSPNMGYDYHWWTHDQYGNSTSSGITFGAKAGLGFDLKIYRNLSMRVEYFLNLFWDKFNINSETVHYKMCIHNIRVGFAYRFSI